MNMHFMKKLDPGSEAASLLVGEWDELDTMVSCFIRMSQTTLKHFEDLTEVPIPTRFVFILLGPKMSGVDYCEIGRGMCAALVDRAFKEVAYKAKSRTELLKATEEFLVASTLLPPDEWDPSIRIDPPASVPSLESRLKTEKVKTMEEEEDQQLEELKANGLVKSGRFGGGLIDDLKRKKPW